MVAASGRSWQVAVRRGEAATLGAALAFGLAVGLPSSPGRAAPPPAAAATAGDVTYAEASAQARSTGAPVEVGAATTETNQVFARPDGTFELEAHRDAVRTDINGAWEPIDTTLTVEPDGTIVPAAITLPVSFAGGGDGPVATAGDGDESLAFTWDEGALPVPVVSGNQVTYPEVRPGVDLVFTVNATGFSDAVVVKSSAAANDLVQDPIEFTGTSPGLELTSAPDGALVASSPDGDVTLTSPPPVAWDSSGGGEGVNEPTEANIGSGELHELTPATVTEGEPGPESSVTIEVAPPETAVQDAETVYPLYLDPQINGLLNTRFRTVHEGGWNYGTPSTDYMRVGYCEWSGCNDSYQRNARSFFEFDVDALTAGEGSDPMVLDARVQVGQVWNADSAPQPVQLRRTTRSFTSSDGYPGPAGTSLQQISSAAGHDPGSAAWLTFDSASVATYVEDEAAAERSKISFALSAPYEGNKYFWKKFNNDTKLSIVYAYVPKVVSYTSTNTIACPGEAVHSDGSIELDVVADPVYGNPNLRYYAQVYETDTANDGPWDSTTVRRSVGWDSGGKTWTTDALTNLPYGRHAWRVSVQAPIGLNDPNGNPYPSPVKATDPATRPFIVDDIAPATPSLSSDDYPANYWGRAEGSPGTIAVQVPSGATGGIVYAFDGDLPVLNDDTCGYTALGYRPASAVVDGVLKLSVPSTLPGGLPHKLTVKAFDKAHNTSAPVSYSFYVSRSFTGTSATNRVEAEGNGFTRGTIGTGSFSGAVTTAGAPGQYLTMTGADGADAVELTMRVNVPGYYALGAGLATCATCGKASISIDGVQVTDPVAVDTAAATSGRLYQPMGGYDLEADRDYKVRIAFPDATATAPQTVKLDYLTVAKIQEGSYGQPGATIQENLAAAFNNNGIASEGGAAASLEPGTTKALSAQKLAAVGIVPGGSFTPTFRNADDTKDVTTTFVIPQVTQGVYDNVIAAGQSIVLPSGTVTDHVDFLVAASCAPVAPTQRRLFDLLHQVPGTTATVTTNPELSGPVPVWSASSTTTLTPIAMPAYASGSPAAVVNGETKLYVMEVDVAQAHRGKVLKEVGLPSTGTSLLRGCSGVPRLHVLAMATRND